MEAFPRDSRAPRGRSPSRALIAVMSSVARSSLSKLGLKGRGPSMSSRYNALSQSREAARVLPAVPRGYPREATRIPAAIPTGQHRNAPKEETRISAQMGQGPSRLFPSTLRREKEDPKRVGLRTGGVADATSLPSCAPIAVPSSVARVLHQGHGRAE